MATLFKSDAEYMGRQAIDVVLATVALALTFWLPDLWRTTALLYAGMCLGGVLERKNERRRLIGIVNRAGLGH